MSELWDHQKAALERAKKQRDLALFCDPGTGKTRMAIEILREKFNAEKRIRRTLILTPLVVAPQWARQFMTYSKTPAEKILVLTGPGAQRLKRLAQARAQHPAGFIAVMNYEGLLIKGMAEALEDWEVEILIADESHRMKDPSSARFKKLRPIADACAHRFILTGSPILNSPMDIYGQLRLLNRGESFMAYDPRQGRQAPMSFFQFQRHYFYDKNAGMPSHVHFPDWRPRPNTTEELRRVLEQVAVQAKKEECLDLPELIESVIPVDLGKDQRKAYNEMREMYVTMVKDQAITASLAITQTLRLQQILNGFVQASPEADPHFFEDNPRFDALMEKTKDLVEQGQKVIIWTQFIPTYDRIAQGLKKLKIDSVFLTGRESAKQKNENVLAFAEPDGPQVIITHPKAGGEGVELTRAKSAIYYARSYSRGDAIQSQARNHRGGSEMHDCITHYDLRAEGTLDEVIANALADKANIAETLLAWARSQ